MMRSLKGRTEILLLCCFEQGAEVLPKSVSWAHSESPLLRHPIPTGDPQSIRRAWCGKKIWLFHENWILTIWRHHGKLSCTSGMCPICMSENKLKPPLILVPCQYYSSLHASAFSGLPSAKVTSILICRDGLCRGPLRAGSPIALGAAQTPTKPVKSPQPCETPHKHTPDNLDMGNRILQYCRVHLSPAVFWNTFFHKIALAVAIFLSTQRCLLTKQQQMLFRTATAS